MIDHPTGGSGSKTDARAESPETRRLGMILFLAALSVLFAASMAGYLVVRLTAAEWPPPGSPPLPVGLWASTIVLLASSGTMAAAVKGARKGRSGAIRRGLLFTLALGSLFLILQVWNWTAMGRPDAKSPSALYGFTFYMLTGLHAAHVLGGLGSLAFTAARASRGAYTVEHHAGVDHLIPTELMLKKIAEAIAARADPDFVIIARTNARRVHDLDEALRRAEAFHRAGADMLFVHTRDAEEMRVVGERLPPPLMTFAPPDGFSGFPFSPRDLAGLGYRLAASSGTAFAAMIKAVRESYECLAQGKMDPFLGPGGADKEMKAAQTTSGLERLLEIERRTMKE